MLEHSESVRFVSPPTCSSSTDAARTKPVVISVQGAERLALETGASTIYTRDLGGSNHGVSEFKRRLFQEIHS